MKQVTDRYAAIGRSDCTKKAEMRKQAAVIIQFPILKCEN